MASTDARPIPRKNTAFRAYFNILDADGDPVTGASSLDSEVSIDGGTFTDCTAEATEIGSTGMYYLDLTAAEMNGDGICVQVKTATSGAKTTQLVFYPEELGDIRANAAQVGGQTATASGEVTFPNATLASTTNITGASGVALSAAGLDAIAVTDPAGVANTFPKMVVQLWRRFFVKTTLTATELKTYADNGTTVRTTQTVSDDGTTQTQGTAS